jgi:hypothetical protein
MGSPISMQSVRFKCGQSMKSIALFTWSTASIQYCTTGTGTMNCDGFVAATATVVDCIDRQSKDPSPTKTHDKIVSM